MPARSLLVEERLRVILVYLDVLKRFAVLMDADAHDVAQFEAPRDFASWVARMAEATSSHVLAIRMVLPPSCTSLDAPAVMGGVR